MPEMPLEVVDGDDVVTALRQIDGVTPVVLPLHAA